jgi:hypothetical protein
MSNGSTRVVGANVGARHARVTGRDAEADAQPTATASWMNVRTAALMLGFGAVSFRRLLDRHSRRAADGSIEVNVDGVHARKIGRTWRVRLSSAWTGAVASQTERGDAK